MRKGKHMPVWAKILIVGALVHFVIIVVNAIYALSAMTDDTYNRITVRERWRNLLFGMQMALAETVNRRMARPSTSISDFFSILFVLAVGFWAVKWTGGHYGRTVGLSAICVWASIMASFIVGALLWRKSRTGHSFYRIRG